METQEIFNQMMENAIVYLQEKGYIPKQPAQHSEDRDPSEDYDPKKETEILRNAGLL